jgi:hypothetical protein
LKLKNKQSQTVDEKWLFILAMVKVKLFFYRPLGLREVETPTFSDIRLIDGGKVVSPTRLPLFTPREISGTHFCQKLSRPEGHSVAGRIR